MEDIKYEHIAYIYKFSCLTSNIPVPASIIFKFM